MLTFWLPSLPSLCVNFCHLLTLCRRCRTSVLLWFVVVLIICVITEITYDDTFARFCCCLNEMVFCLFVFYYICGVFLYFLLLFFPFLLLPCVRAVCVFHAFSRSTCGNVICFVFVCIAYGFWVFIPYHHFFIIIIVIILLLLLQYLLLLQLRLFSWPEEEDSIWWDVGTFSLFLIIFSYFYFFFSFRLGILALS